MTLVIRMRKLNLLLSVMCMTFLVQSAKTVSPGQSTTIDFSITNPSGYYEFCVDSVLLQFTDHLGDVSIATLMPVYPKVCVCPPSDKSTCFSYAGAGTAYGQSLGYTYAPSDSYEISFGIKMNPNAASSLAYPGIPHNYTVSYSYKSVYCEAGCWFESPQQGSYSGLIYVQGLTKNQVVQAGNASSVEQDAAASLEEAQNYVSDALSAVEQANNTISLALNARCISTSTASSYISDAVDNYSSARAFLSSAQSSYNSYNYVYARYNATVAEQFAIQTKNEADMATNLIQAELQRLGPVLEKIKEANASVSYSITLEAQAETIGVTSDISKSLNSLALEHLNKTDSECNAGEYDAVIDSADIAEVNSNASKQILEPLVRDKLVEIYSDYVENLTKARDGIGNFSAEYDNLTIDNLTIQRDNIRNGTYTDFLIYVKSIPSTGEMVGSTVTGLTDINRTLDRMRNITYLGSTYNQMINYSEVLPLLQNSVVELSLHDFNDSVNFTSEAILKLDGIETDLRAKISKIENAETLIQTAKETMSNVLQDTLFILKPDLSESNVALQNATSSLYSNPDNAADFATEAKVLALQQKNRIDSTRTSIVGAVIIIIIIAVIIGSTKSPLGKRRKLFKDKW